MMLVGNGVVRVKQLEIPAYAGMTKGDAGMTKGNAGTTDDIGW
jgi:hypothetical protein